MRGARDLGPRRVEHRDASPTKVSSRSASSTPLGRAPAVSPPRRATASTRSPRRGAVARATISRASGVQRRPLVGPRARVQRRENAFGAPLTLYATRPSSSSSTVVMSLRAESNAKSARRLCSRAESRTSRPRACAYARSATSVGSPATRPPAASTSAVLQEAAIEARASSSPEVSTTRIRFRVSVPSCRCR